MTSQLHHELLEYRPANVLASLRRGIGMPPRADKVVTQCHQAFLLLRRQVPEVFGLDGGRPLFLTAHLLKPLVPAMFQFPGHAPVGGVHGIILAPGQVGHVARLRRSLLITANPSFGQWDAIIPEQTMTPAAIGRLVHRSTIFELDAESYRRRTAVGSQRRRRREASRATSVNTPVYPSAEVLS